MAARSFILRPEDKMELDLNRQETEGLGPSSYEAQRGM
jgi:hypothetical protein